MQERGTQNFLGTVDKVAGRDVNIYRPCPHSANQEWEIQKSFEKATGISCNKKAREWLTSLMNDHGFTARELSTAWRFRTIGWDQNRDEYKLDAGWFDLICACCLFAGATFYFALVAAVFLLGPGAEYKYALHIIQGSGVMYLLVCWCIRKIFLQPRSITLRVKNVEQEKMHKSLAI